MIINVTEIGASHSFAGYSREFKRNVSYKQKGTALISKCFNGFWPFHYEEFYQPYHFFSF